MLGVEEEGSKAAASFAHPPKVLSHVTILISARDPEVEEKGGRGWARSAIFDLFLKNKSFDLHL